MSIYNIKETMSPTLILQRLDYLGVECLLFSGNKRSKELAQGSVVQGNDWTKYIVDPESDFRGLADQHGTVRIYTIGQVIRSET